MGTCDPAYNVHVMQHELQSHEGCDRGSRARSSLFLCIVPVIYRGRVWPALLVASSSKKYAIARGSFMNTLQKTGSQNNHKAAI